MVKANGRIYYSFTPPPPPSHLPMIDFLIIKILIEILKKVQTGEGGGEDANTK